MTPRQRQILKTADAWAKVHGRVQAVRIRGEVTISKHRAAKINRENGFPPSARVKAGDYVHVFALGLTKKLQAGHSGLHTIPKDALRGPVQL